LFNPNELFTKAYIAGVKLGKDKMVKYAEDSVYLIVAIGHIAVVQQVDMF
jgi:hypothetical protein